jgi:hypothetical protein
VYDGFDQILNQVEQLTQLTSLRLHNVLTGDAQSAAAYAALTANSKLQVLHVTTAPCLAHAARRQAAAALEGAGSVAHDVRGTQNH